MSRILLALTLLSAASAAKAEIVDIRWSGDGRFQHSTSVPAGKFLEVCGKLAAGLQVRWQFESAARVDFNVHYHQGKEVMYPVKLSAVPNARDTLDVGIAQDYCWMWSNKSAVATTLTLSLQR